MNDKCAAGTGRGMEVFADLIRVPVWEIGTRSFKIQKEPPRISSTCVVFAKSEVVSLLESGVSENEMMAAYCSAMAHRIVELLNRLGVREKFVITGGIAKNEGVVKRLEKELGMKTAEPVWKNKKYRDRGYPFDTQLAGAIGAALFVGSDSVLAYQRFREPLEHGRWLVLGTYFAAQCGIALSVVAYKKTAGQNGQPSRERD